jgi:hypothetical protein
MIPVFSPLLHSATSFNCDSGVTPFSIAVKSRKWDTARLILAIAAAQYEADEEDVVKNIDLGNSTNSGHQLAS